ncbi:MAG: T9SS type A sorting domain-containing protein [Sphingobacteriales bacterium]|nr:MAG: T9SS type A sorting domain-containing protein [Sphingobacteriales bacterium]
MKTILNYILALTFSTQYLFAHGWVSYFLPEYFLGPAYTSVFDLFELENGNYLCTGMDPGMVMLNSETGDTISTSNIVMGHAVRTTDGGYFIGVSKLNNNFDIEWVATDVSSYTYIQEAILSSNNNVYFSGISYLLYGDAPIPYEYNSISQISLISESFSEPTILALPVQTLDNWAADENNDMVPLLDGNGWMVFAHCNNCGCCFIKVTYPFTFSQNCLGSPADTRSIIHANEGDGYIVTMGNRVVIKVDLNGNIIWSKIYQTTVPPPVPYVYGFHDIISTGADGYIAVGRTNYDEKLWVIKIDNNGNEQWQSDHIRIKNYRTVGRTVMKTSDGGYLIGGVAVVSFADYTAYPFFVKMDSTGNCRPQAAFTHSLDNYTLNIETNTSSGAHEYTWLFGNSDTAQTAMPVYTYPNPGTYNLCLVATNPCGNDTLCTQIDVATGTHTPKSNVPTLSLYPNPVSANQNIFWQADGISSGASLELRVFNLTGNILYREQPNQPSGILPSHTWPPGLYFLQLITPNYQSTVRLVVSGE